jgi:cob(I)alamin adenosyltransferase
VLNATTSDTVSAKIYTKTGDNGSSKTITGTRTLKSDLSFEVLGTCDELNATLGILRTSKKKDLIKVITGLQSDLFKIGSYFAGVKFTKVEAAWLKKRTEEIEIDIDKIEKKNKPLKNFILPGGSFESGHLHLARTVCRRLERSLVRYSKAGYPEMKTYINRLSDYLFVLARQQNNGGKKDIIWKS